MINQWQKILVSTMIVATLTLIGVGACLLQVARADEPLVFDKKTDHYTDLSYSVLSDSKLSWEERTRLFGGETTYYEELSAKERDMKKRELKRLLSKINAKLVQQCEVEIRAWLNRQAQQNIPAYSGRNIYHVQSGAVVFFRAYEIFGDKKHLEMGSKFADQILKAQWPKGHWRWGNYGEDYVRIQDGYNDKPFWIMLYAYKLTRDKKYLDSAKRCADVLLSLQRPGGGWPDQWTFSGRGTGHTGVRNGISFNDSGTNAPFQMMVMMYHMTKDKKYVAKLHKLGPFMVKANLGKGKVVGWSEQYHDNARPTRARGYEIELPYPRTLTRATGPLLIWLYLMTGEEKHMELLKRAYAWHEYVRQKELDPKQIEAWKLMTRSWAKARGPLYYRPGWPDAWLPDGSNWGRVTAYKMIPWHPVSPAMKKKYGNLIHRSETDHGFPGKCGYLMDWRKIIKAGGNHPECSWGFSHAARNNTLGQIRRALLEHRRGGYKGLLKYYSNPTKYTPDQYLQARIDAAKRVLNQRNVKIASMHDKGIRAVKGPQQLMAMKTRWYGPKKCKWGIAYLLELLGISAWYQWQMVYDAKLARGEISADQAARGGRGLETVAMQTHLDSWDVLGEWGMHTFEIENLFDVPLRKN